MTTDINVAILKNPDRWVRWPFLPVVKRDGSYKYGLVMEGKKPGELLLFEGANLFGNIRSLEIADAKVTNAEDLVAESWVVD